MNAVKTYKNVLIDDMKIDRRYQREQKEHKIKSIMKEFDITKVDELILSKHKDGTYTILDGGHRAEVLKRLSVKSIGCIVYENLTFEEEAIVFENRNSGKLAIKREDIFKARLAYNDPESIAIEKIALKNNCKVGGGNSKTNYNIRATDTLRSIYKKDQGESLDKVLKIVIEIWNGNIESLSKRMLYGMHLFLNKYINSINLDDLITKLKKYEAIEITRKGRIVTQTTGGGTDENTARVILNIYNANKKHKLEDKFTK